MGTALQEFQEEIEAKRKEGCWNVLMPTQTFHDLSPFHKPVLEIVRIETEDVYEPVYKSGNFALHATALFRMGYAAGLIWNARNCRRTDNGNDPDVVSYQMEAATRKEDGTWVLLNEEYMLDLKVIKEELEASYDKKVSTLIKDKKLKEDGRKNYIEKNVKGDVLQKRKFRLQIAQTGAMDRVIRKILGLKGAYTKEELAKSYIVPPIVFQPDFSDLETREMLFICRFLHLMRTLLTMARKSGRKWP